MTFIYFITAKNIEVVQKCNSSINSKIIVQFVSHVMAFLFVVIIGGAGINSFLDNKNAAYFVSFIIAIVAFLCDRAVIENSVVSPMDGLIGKHETFKVSFILRLILSVVVAFAVSVPIELQLQNSYLQKINKENYKKDNAELFAKTENFREELLEQNQMKIQSVDENLTYYQNQLDELARTKKNITDRISELREDLSNARYQRGQESSGQDGRKKGEGHLFTFWDQNVTSLEDELEVYENDKIKVLSDISRNERMVRQLHREKKDYLNYSPNDELSEFSRELRKQPEFQGLEDGLLVRLMLLKQLHSHPDLGLFTTMISILLLVFFALIEMSPLVVHKLSRIGEYERQLFLYEKSLGVRLVKEHEVQIAKYRNSIQGANVVSIESVEIQNEEEATVAVHSI